MKADLFLSLSKKNYFSQQRVLFSYRCALFLSAFLIFIIQPLFTRLVIPNLGGAAIVWSINLCFFQGCLLCGYVYAHALVRFFSLKYAVLLHTMLLFGIGINFLPIHMPLPPEEASKSIIWLITTLATTIGFPFFILSATAPLLQSWFQATDHPRADDPYFLYVASNWGSIAALVSFIFFFEPLTTLSQQKTLWSYGFGILALSIGVVGFQSLLYHKSSNSDSESLKPSSWRDRFLWMSLAFVPSGMLVAVTALLSMDVSSFPLLWVFPLALYLLTFILTFSQKPFINSRFFEILHPIFSIFAFMISLPLFYFRVAYFTFFFYVGVFFITAMVCHGRLVKHRPVGAHCTDFYLWLSFGGVLGSLFATFIAPLLFSSALEFSLLILAGLALRSVKILWNQFFVGFFIVFFLGGVASFFVAEADSASFFLKNFMILSLFLLSQISLKRQGSLMGVLCAVFMVGNIVVTKSSIQRYRSFFGIYTITESQMNNGNKQRTLLHGNTVHGAEIIPADGSSFPKPDPILYYYPGGALHTIFEATRLRKGTLRVGVLGLGTGSLACYKQEEDQWIFFEIDPLVVALAQKHFHYLAAYAPHTPIILGDGRLSLARHKQTYDVLVLDAFSSDGVPTHLLTRESLKMYRSVLAEDGLIVFHISNRYMNLAPIIASTAQQEGLYAWKNPKATLDPQNDKLWFPSKVVVVSAKKENLGTLGQTWIPIESTVSPWTDDYANILGALWRGWN